MERFALWAQTVFQEDELRYVLDNHGQLFVTRTGIMKMQVCCAGNLDFLLMVDYACVIVIQIHSMTLRLLYIIGAIAASGRYTEGLLTFGITDIHCNGTEQNISLCAQNEVLLHNCQTHDDAGAICQGTR